MFTTYTCCLAFQFFSVSCLQECNFHAIFENSPFKKKISCKGKLVKFSELNAQVDGYPEQDVAALRMGLTNVDPDITICENHRETTGKKFRFVMGTKACLYEGHKVGAKTFKKERGRRTVSYELSQDLLRKSQLVVPFGLPCCTNCHLDLTNISEAADEPMDDSQDIPLSQISHHSYRLDSDEDMDDDKDYIPSQPKEQRKYQVHFSALSILKSSSLVPRQ